MSDYQLFIDGKDVSADVKDLNKVKLTVALDSERQVVEYGTTSELEITGDTAKFIDEFVRGCTSLDMEVPALLKVNTASCGIVEIPLVVNARGSKCCPEICKAYVALSTSNDDTRAKDKLDRTLYYENGFDTAFEHPRVQYCDQQTDFLYAILLTIRQIITAVLYPLYLAFQAIQGVVNFLRSDLKNEAACLQGISSVESTYNISFTQSEKNRMCNGRDGLREFRTVEILQSKGLTDSQIESAFNTILITNADGSTGNDLDLNPIDNLLSLVDRFLTGCGRYVHCPLLREIFEYQSQQCGLQFKSSSLQSLSSTRYDSCIACLDVEQGVSCEEDVNWQEGNQPLTTVLELMGMYAQMINGEVRIINGCVYIERKDFFDRFQGQLEDITQPGATSIDDEICYLYDLDELCSSDKIEYCEDQEEKEGKKVQRLYRSFKSYVNGTAANLRRKCETVLPFSPARFIYDNASFERNGILDFDATQDNFRDGGFSLFGNQSKVRDRDLILSGDKTSKCKLLALERSFDRKDARVIRRKIGEREVGLPFFGLSSTKSFYTYNEPWQMEALCQDYFNINDPNVGKRPLLKVEGLRIKMTCQALNQLLDRNIQAAVNTHKGMGLADGWTICFEECVIEPEGDVRVFC